jgi:hypothetical protein
MKHPQNLIPKFIPITVCKNAMIAKTQSHLDTVNIARSCRISGVTWVVTHIVKTQIMLPTKQMPKTHRSFSHSGPEGSRHCHCRRGDSSLAIRAASCVCCFSRRSCQSWRGTAGAVSSLGVLDDNLHKDLDMHISRRSPQSITARGSHT